MRAVDDANQVVQLNARAKLCGLTTTGEEKYWVRK